MIKLSMSIDNGKFNYSYKCGEIEKCNGNENLSIQNSIFFHKALTQLLEVIYGKCSSTDIKLDKIHRILEAKEK